MKNKKYQSLDYRIKSDEDINALFELKKLKATISLSTLPYRIRNKRERYEREKN